MYISKILVSFIIPYRYSAYCTQITIENYETVCKKKICFYGRSKNRSFKKEENFLESVSMKKQQLSSAWHVKGSLEMVCLH